MISKDKKLNGLVLSGGKSTRMGMDKGLIEYHGKPQREYLYGLLQKVCDEVYMSIREDQETGVPGNLKYIKDKNRVNGPFNGLLSAHEFDPLAGWLVLACDLPMITQQGIEFLIANRDFSKAATAYATRESKLPEPLCAIWEPEALSEAEKYLEKGNGTCPRKFLINSDVQLVFPEDDQLLVNANSQEDYREVKAKLTAVER